MAAGPPLTYIPALQGGRALAYPLQLLSHDHSKVASHAAGNRESEPMVDWTSVEDDLDLVRRTRTNLLVIGPDRLVIDVVSRVIADVPYGIIPCTAHRVRLPAALPRGSTLVLRDVDELDAHGQTALFEWLEHRNGEPQIVCTGSGLLPLLISTGRFDPRLYYRLNVVCIDLSDS